MNDEDRSEAPRLSHVDADGRLAMVDVSAKAVTRRVAKARGVVTMAAATARALAGGELQKGDAIATARLAGVMAAKRTSELIPLCHGLGLDHIDVTISLEAERAVIEATAVTTARTGVEMEVLTAVSVAALTLYDMAKAIDREMVIGEILLLEKHGGRSGSWVRSVRSPQAAEKQPT
jgi:cyclic pyranopterin phosphate synthase